MIENPIVPDGWSTEVVGTHHTAITAPAIGCVTIDWRERCYRGGLYVRTGRPQSTAKYIGRGWQDRLVHDAIEWLRKVTA